MAEMPRMDVEFTTHVFAKEAVTGATLRAVADWLAQYDRQHPHCADSVRIAVAVTSALAISEFPDEPAQ